MAPVALGAAWAGGWWLAGLLALVGTYATIEWNRMTSSAHAALSILNAVVFILAGISFVGQGVAVALLFLGAGASLAVIVGILTRTGPLWPVLGLLYLGSAMIALLWIREFAGWVSVLWLFVIVWATDIGAYLSGSLIGGPKLVPRISPNKTWAGLVGGCMLAAILSSALLFWHGEGWARAVPLALLVLLGLLLAVGSQVGDIVESWIKRHFKVKDSGTLIPGHGGILDRIDSLVFIAPFVAVSLFLIGEYGIPLNG